MADLPYYFQDESGTKKLEGLVPLIILVLIALVLVGKTTDVFCGIPGLDAVFCGGGNLINIAVIGSLEDSGLESATLVNAPELRAYLDGPGRACNMQYTQYSPDDLTWAKDSLLKNFDLIILAGDRDYTRPVRTAVESYLNSGGKIIIIGDAATKDPEDALYNGWGHISSPVVLVNRVSDGKVNDGIPYVEMQDAVLRITDLENPLNVGYMLSSNLSETNTSCKGVMNVIDVNPDKGNTIDILSGIDLLTGKRKTLPAIVEQTSVFGGTVYYFSFDPGCMPNMWISAVQEITGKQTC